MPEFRSLAEILLPQKPLQSPLAEEPVVEVEREPSEEATDDALHEAARFHAYLREELLRTVGSLSEAIARDVLSRELQLQGADIEMIVERAITQYQASEPLRVRVCPARALDVSGALPIVADESLSPYDAVLELRSGCVDLRLETRLDDVLRAVLP